MRKILLTLAILLTAAAQSLALAHDEDRDSVPSEGEVNFYLGVFEPRGDSDLWDFNEKFLTQDVTDFDDAIGGLGFATHLGPYVDFMVGGQYYEAETRVRYKNIFASDGSSLKQDHRLRELPIDISIKFLPVPREIHRGNRGRTVLRPVVPYIGGGVGGLLWDYEETGQFVDDVENPTFSFNDARKARGVTGSVHALAGVEVQFTREFALWFEGRYRWATDRLGSDFPDELDRFDLSGGSLAMGASIRF